MYERIPRWPNQPVTHCTAKTPGTRIPTMTSSPMSRELVISRTNLPSRSETPSPPSPVVGTSPASVDGPEPSLTPNPYTNYGVTFDQALQSQCAFWQGILNLSEWHIHVQTSRLWEMADHDCVGQCEAYPHRKDAVIRVLDPNDLGAVRGRFFDGEECDYDLTLVHELLHLHFDPMWVHPTDHNQTVMTEQAINAISKALVTLYRVPRVGPPSTELPSPTPAPSVDHVGRPGHYF